MKITPEVHTVIGRCRSCGYSPEPPDFFVEIYDMDTLTNEPAEYICHDCDRMFENAILAAQSRFLDYHGMLVCADCDQIAEDCHC